MMAQALSNATVNLLGGGIPALDRRVIRREKTRHDAGEVEYNPGPADEEL